MFSIAFVGPMWDLMMAGNIYLTLQVLLLMNLGFCYSTVDPPENLTITDPGHLGNLEISWSPSQEQVRMKEQGQCLVLYELHYYDSYSSSWTSIRTTQTSFRAQFDLGQEVKVRIYTLISGACADGRTAKSKNFTEVVQKPDMAGIDGLQDFICLYYYMEHLFCSWKRSSKMPAKAQEAFYYWHREMAHTKECPFYILSGGFRSGCNFSGTDLPTFSDINLCVNMSSDDPVRPLYVTLQIQNIVKPKPPGDLRVEAGADKQLRVHWGSPAGRIPQHCLLWQVQTRREGQEEKPTRISSTETAVMLALPDNEMSCLRVRCMLNKYCANSGVWSDWSPSVCYPEKRSLASVPSQGMFPKYRYIAIANIKGLVTVCACELSSDL
ncbi:interleukin-13 receptor subunit alpha-2 [Periophthalmus magnuspinnatus]|uniref:interleukin-13 receptor subunit alpha-2 n=1 Tax=Periophthalmus magnuspinnatus TaxID=409849 RepID=UPI00243667B2|nr:interleukin-13 receptor subunit alpha-2 [Periophthalmus magnuspinnatus]